MKHEIQDALQVGADTPLHALPKFVPQERIAHFDNQLVFLLSPFQDTIELAKRRV